MGPVVAVAGDILVRTFHALLCARESCYLQALQLYEFSMADWIPMFTLPNITLTEPIETEGVALVSTGDERIAEIISEHPAFQTYIQSFKTEFDRSLAPSFVLVHNDAPQAFRGVEALAAFRDILSVSTIPLSWAKSLRFGHPAMGIHYSNWFSIYPWMLGKNSELLVSVTMATNGVDDVKRLRGQSSAGLTPRHIDKNLTDHVLLDELLRRWQKCYRAKTPEREDVALFRSLNMANSAALLPAGIEVTTYDIGRSVSLWVSAFEILSPAKRLAYFNVYENLKRVEYGLSAFQSADYEAHGFKERPVKETLPCWIYGELYKARNDFLHGNPVTQDRLTVRPTDRSLFIYAAPLYRLGLTGFLDLHFKRPIPSKDDTAAFAAFISDRMDFRFNQGNIESGISTILYTEEEDRARSKGQAVDPAANLWTGLSDDC